MRGGNGAGSRVYTSRLRRCWSTATHTGSLAADQAAAALGSGGRRREHLLDAGRVYEGGTVVLRRQTCAHLLHEAVPGAAHTFYELAMPANQRLSDVLNALDAGLLSPPCSSMASAASFSDARDSPAPAPGP